jgi:pimeloyl-ACP methyl ester carboxylesterase
MGDALMVDVSTNFMLPRAKRTLLDIGESKVAVYDTDGDKPAIVFVHGNSSSSRAWRKQFASPLPGSYRLIAVDLPGHGASDHVREEHRAATYSLPGYAAVIDEVARQMDAESAVFVGWSLGGHMLLEAAEKLSKAAGFMIFGAPPIGFPPDPTAFLKLGLGFVDDLTLEQANEYVSEFFAAGARDIPRFFLEDVQATDGQARAGLGASIGPEGYADEVAIAAAMTRPLAVLQGQGEQIVNPAYLAGLNMPTLWRGAVQTLAGAGHAIQWEQAIKFDETLAAFTNDCARSA